MVTNVLLKTYQKYPREKVLRKKGKNCFTENESKKFWYCFGTEDLKWRIFIEKETASFHSSLPISSFPILMWIGFPGSLWQSLISKAPKQSLFSRYGEQCILGYWRGGAMEGMASVWSYQQVREPRLGYLYLGFELLLALFHMQVSLCSGNLYFNVRWLILV